MISGEKLRRRGDVECEREYGYVHSISGPSMKTNYFYCLKLLKNV